MRALPMLVVVLLWSACALYAEDRKEIPTEVQRSEVLKLVREVFADEYKSIKREDRLALALTLLKQGRESNSDFAARFVLLREAQAVAAPIGDGLTVLEAGAILIAEYQIPLSEGLTVPAQKATTKMMPEDAMAFITTLEGMAETRGAAHQYQEAMDLVNAALPAAVKTKDMAVLIRVRGEIKHYRDITTESEKVRQAKLKLTSGATDVAAQTLVGRFQYLVLGDPAGAYQYLVAGDDVALRTIAEQESMAPVEVADQIVLADRWYTYADGQTGVYRDAARVRSGNLYQNLLPQVEGIQKAKIEKRLKTLPAPSEAMPEIRAPAAVAVPGATGGAVAVTPRATSATLLRQVQSALSRKPTRITGTVQKDITLSGVVVLDRDAQLQGGVVLRMEPGTIVVNNSGIRLPVLASPGMPIISISKSWEHARGKDDQWWDNAIFVGDTEIGSYDAPNFRNCLFIGRVHHGGWARDRPGMFTQCAFYHSKIPRLSCLLYGRECVYDQCSLDLTERHKVPAGSMASAYILGGTLMNDLSSVVYEDAARLTMTTLRGKPAWYDPALIPLLIEMLRPLCSANGIEIKLE